MLRRRHSQPGSPLLSELVMNVPGLVPGSSNAPNPPAAGSALPLQPQEGCPTSPSALSPCWDFSPPGALLGKPGSAGSAGAGSAGCGNSPAPPRGAAQEERDPAPAARCCCRRCCCCDWISPVDERSRRFCPVWLGGGLPSPAVWSAATLLGRSWEEKGRGGSLILELLQFRECYSVNIKLPCTNTSILR